MQACEEIEVWCVCGRRDVRARYHSDPPEAVRLRRESCAECRRPTRTSPVFLDGTGAVIHRAVSAR